jgi:hypothetical protein
MPRLRPDPPKPPSQRAFEVAIHLHDVNLQSRKKMDRSAAIHLSEFKK